MPENLLESELFGHRKGSFTGAHEDKKGLFEIADGGTLFLDEASEMPMALQSKLLRALQEGEIRPLGAAHEKKVDVRIVAATNRNLEKEVAEGRFREDLYYRLNVFPIRVPPLRERRDDIPLLAEHFLKRYAAEMGKPAAGFAQQAMELLQAYDFPGTCASCRTKCSASSSRSSTGGFVTPELLSGAYPAGRGPRRSHQADEDTAQRDDGQDRALKPPASRRAPRAREQQDGRREDAGHHARGPPQEAPVVRPLITDEGAAQGGAGDEDLNRKPLSP